MSTQKSKTSGGHSATKSTAHPTKRSSHSTTSKAKLSGKRKPWLLYGGIAAAAVAAYGVSRIPLVRTMVLPVVATAVTKNWGTIRAALQRA